jgi:hypothetical protein
MSRPPIPLPLAEPPSIELRSWFSDVRIEGVQPGGTPQLEVRGPAAERVVARLEGTTTVVEVPGGWPAEWDGPRQLSLTVPGHARLRLTNETGRTHLARLAGCDVELASRAGAVTLDDVRGRLKLQVDTGSIRGERLAGTFEVRSLAGSVKLGIEALDPGLHLVRTSLGAVKVELARGQAVRLETSTSLGSVRCSYPSTSDAPATLRLEAELGSVRVRSVEQPDVAGSTAPWPDWQSTWRDVARTVADVVADTVSGAIPPPPRRTAPATSEELRRVLELVQSGQVSVQDAERLIRALQ